MKIALISAAVIGGGILLMILLIALLALFVDPPRQPVEPLQMGQTGSTGSWDVTVNSIDDAATYGPSIAAEEAQGVFKVVELTVANTDSESTIFDADNVTLLDAEGREYAPESVLFSDEDLFLEQINPGNSVTGDVVIDVPEGTAVTQVKIQDPRSFEPVVVSAS